MSREGEVLGGGGFHARVMRWPQYFPEFWSDFADVFERRRAPSSTGRCGQWDSKVQHQARET